MWIENLGDKRGRRYTGTNLGDNSGRQWAETILGDNSGRQEAGTILGEETENLGEKNIYAVNNTLLLHCPAHLLVYKKI